MDLFWLRRGVSDLEVPLMNVQSSMEHLKKSEVARRRDPKAPLKMDIGNVILSSSPMVGIRE